MDTNTQSEGEYVAALTERDRDIYSRGYSAGILARSHIDFGPIPLFDPRTQRNCDRAPRCLVPTPMTPTQLHLHHRHRCVPTDADCDHDNIALYPRRRPRRATRTSNAVANPTRP